MLFFSARGRKVPLELQSSLLPLNHDRPGEDAFWLALGGAQPPAGAARRPHRGQLPDVDPAMLVPDPDHVPLLGRLADLLRLLAAGLDRLAGTRRRHLGESA